jgi:colanic acid/amylovoran biosynthesis glycosyltransferase
MGRIDVAYVLHRFPSLTETFVAEEIRSVQSLGVKVHLFSLLSPTTELVHPVSAGLLPQVRYAPEIFAPGLWWAQLYFLSRMPRQYLWLLWSLVVEPAPEFNYILKRLVILLKGVWVAKQLEGSSIRLVHTHFAWLSAAACMVISHLLDLPFTLTAHAYDIYSPKNDLLALTTKTASRVVTISDYNKKSILDRTAALDPQRIEVIRCGIDVDHFQRSDGMPANQVFQIMAVGSLVEKKGHEYLIRACSELKAQGLDFECVIVGEGKLKQRLQTLIQDLGVDGKVTLAGGQTQTWVRDRLGMSDLFALACVIDEIGERDGIPVAMMEALAMEVPVVSTPVSGIPELIRQEETGLLVPQEDPIALAEAMARLLQDEPLRRRLAKNGRALVEREYAVTKDAGRLAGLFRQVIEERRE